MRPGGLHGAHQAAAGQIARQRAGHRFRRGRHADAAGRCAGARHHRLAGRAPTGRRLHADDGLRRRAVRRGRRPHARARMHHPSRQRRSWRRWIPARGSSTTASSSRTARWSAAGITAGIDLALHMVSRHCGPRIACEVAREMLVYQRRAGTDSALSPWLEHRSHLHPGVHKVQDAVVRNPAAPVGAIAGAGSPYQRAPLDPAVPPARGLHADGLSLSDTRRAGARPAARNPAGPERVAEKAGFGSAQHMRRVWRRFEPRTPGMARQQLAA